jgi:hypothetical protein
MMTVTEAVDAEPGFAIGTPDDPPPLHEMQASIAKPVTSADAAARKLPLNR